MIHTNRLKSIIRSRESILLVTNAFLVLFISIVTREFIHHKNLTNILNNNAMFGIMGIGMTLIIATGNIDVSIGAQFAIVGFVTGTFVNYMDKLGFMSIGLVFLFSMIIGAVVGLINGYIVNKLKLPAIVVTLGTMSIMRGSLLSVTKGSWVASVPKWFTKLSTTSVYEINIFTILWFLIAVLFILIFKYTKIGRHVIAFGGNKDSAKRIGITERKIYLTVFTLLGVLNGIASSIYLAQIGSAQPTAGTGYEMSLIAATIIGGNNILGGKASIIGTSLGILLLGIINSAMVFMRIPVYWQSLVTGIIILIALLFSNKRNNIIVTNRGKYDEEKI